MDNLLNELAEQLHTTVPHLWQVLVHQAIVEGLMNLGLIASFLLVSGLLAKFGYYFLKNNNKNDPDTTVAMAIMFFLSGVILFLCILSIPNTITMLVNPEYWALQQILEVLK